MEDLLKIFNIVLENNNLKALDSLNPELRLREDLGLDSLGLAELTVKIQYKYKIDIFEHDFPETIGDVIRILNFEKNI